MRAAWELPRSLGVFQRYNPAQAQQVIFLADVKDPSNDASQPQDEVADFKTAKKDHFDVLCWWKEHAKMFP